MPLQRSPSPEKHSLQFALSRWPAGLTLGARHAAMVVFVVLLPIMAPGPAWSQTAEPATSAADPAKDDALVADSVRAFLETETAPLGDAVEIDLRPTSSALGECVAPEPFLPRAGVPQGRVTVGVRCEGDSRPRYVQAMISAQIRHLVTTRTLQAGERLDASALGWETADLSRLRRGYLDDVNDIIDTVATRRLAAGATLTEAMIREPWLVKRGDSVVLTARGQGFRITRSVEALDNGTLGSTIRLKTGSNQILQGKVTGPDRLAIDF